MEFRYHGTKVLVADDDAGAATLLIRRLQTFGLTVSYVPDKELICQRLSAEHFDALITDLSFYRTFDVIKTIRKISQTFPILPIIGMTEAPPEVVHAQYPDAETIFARIVQKDDAMNTVATIAASTLNNVIVNDEAIETVNMDACPHQSLHHTLVYRLHENDSPLLDEITQLGLTLHTVSETNIARLARDTYVVVDLTIASGVAALSALQFARCIIVVASDLPHELVKMTFNLPAMTRVVVQCHGRPHQSAQEIISTLSALTGERWSGVLPAMAGNTVRQ